MDGNGSSPVYIYVGGANDKNRPTADMYGGSADTNPPSRDFAAKTPVPSGKFPVAEPHEIAKAFPARWAEYIRANYRSVLHVQQVFQVSERTAYRWWKGDGGAKGSHVAIAVAEHPETAPSMLFAAE
ncbi:MAG: hypothetical protein AAFQ05_09965 [Pseudomonadota bacterium]